MFLTPDDAAAILRRAGAEEVHVVVRMVVGRGRTMLAFFEFRRKYEVWVIRADGWVRNFERDVEREFGTGQRKAA